MGPPAVPPAMSWLRRNRASVRDAGVVLAFYVLLLALARVPFQPLQVPGYLLALGFDAIQNRLAPGLGGGGFQVAFGAYLLALSAVGAAAAARLRRRFAPAGPVRYGVAGALVAVGVLALVVLLVVFVPFFTGSWTPLAIAAATGLAGLWLGWRLAATGTRADGRADGG